LSELSKLSQFPPLDFRLDAADFYLSVARSAARSVVRSAESGEAWTDSQAQAWQARLWAALQRQIALFTLGDSSSVPAETAQSVLRSVHYAMGIRLKQAGDEAGAYAMLKEREPEELLQEGRDVLRKRLTRGKVSLGLAQSTSVPCSNIAYRDTLYTALPMFFRLYDPLFAAHETPCMIDYPLFSPVTGLSGLEYIEQYLSRITMENALCRHFTPKQIDGLLAQSCPEPAEMLINLFEPVFFSAIGAEMLAARPEDGAVPKQACLLSELQSLSAKQIEDRFVRAAGQVLSRYRIEGAQTKAYYQKAAAELSHRMFTRLRSGSDFSFPG